MLLTMQLQHPPTFSIPLFQCKFYSRLVSVNIVPRWADQSHRYNDHIALSLFLRSVFNIFSSSKESTPLACKVGMTSINLTLTFPVIFWKSDHLGLLIPILAPWTWSMDFSPSSTTLISVTPILSKLICQWNMPSPAIDWHTSIDILSITFHNLQLFQSWVADLSHCVSAHSFIGLTVHRLQSRNYPNV